MKHNAKIVAVIVTFNNARMLGDLLEDLQRQSLKPGHDDAPRLQALPLQILQEILQHPGVVEGYDDGCNPLAVFHVRLSPLFLFVRPQQADAAELRPPVLDDLDGIAGFPDLVPEPVHLAAALGGVGNDVVKTDHAAGTHERPVHLEVLPDPFIGVVPVDEQEIHHPAPEDFPQRLQGGRFVRVPAEQMDPLAGFCEGAVQRGSPRRVPAPEAPPGRSMLTIVASAEATLVSMKSVPPEAVPISTTVDGLRRATSPSSPSISIRLCRGRMKRMAGENTASRAASKPVAFRRRRRALRQSR